MKINQVFELIKINKILINLDNHWKDFFSKTDLIKNAKIETIYKNNGIGLDIAGKKLFIPNSQSLFKNEFIDFKVNKKEPQVELEIIKRNYLENEKETISSFGKNSYKIFDSFLEGKDIEETKLFKLLNSFFPELEWNEKTKFFEWEFLDSKANGYSGRKKDQNFFFMEIDLKKLGSLEIYFFFKKEDLSDMRIHIFSKKITSYILLVKDIEILKKSFFETGLELNFINIYFNDEKKEWLI